MKRIRRVAACVLAVMLLGIGALAEDMGVMTDAESGVYGAVGETPEQIIISAMEIFSWFTISPLDVDPELSGGGDTWRVADETLCDHETMMRLLYDTFSEEIVTEMLAYEVYEVIDGSLYTSAGGRAIDENIAWAEYEESYSDEDMIVYTVTVHYFGEELYGIEPDVFEFIRERAEEKWLFSQFPFFW